MKKVAIPLMVCVALVLTAIPVLADTQYFQGFEVNTDGWFETVNRVASSATIPAAAGGYYAEVAPGAYTRFGAYESTFPAGGYTTSIDIYLNVGGNYANDTRFDYSSAISTPLDPNTNTFTHRRDFIFHVGYYNDSDLTGTGPRFVVSASNNAPGWPKNPGRDKASITETGWYTFIHKFSNNGGVLQVDLSVTKLNGTPVTGATWTLSNPTDIIGTAVGGHRYGWFVNSVANGATPFLSLAIDNVNLLSVNQAASVSACKNGGWQGLARADGSLFTSQGDCIQYVNTGK